MTGSLFVKNADGTFKLKNDERVKNQKCTQVKQPGKWQVLNVSTKKAEEISEETLLKTVSQKFLDHVKWQSARGTKKYIEVPPGDSKMHEEFPEDLEKGALIQYRQPQKIRICFVVSFESFLHLCNCKQHAVHLYSEYSKDI